jgi:uncharacterized protein
MKTNREIVADACGAWSRGEAYVSSIFADDMTGEIVGRSRASKTYGSAQQFSDEVLHPFGQRFRPDTPFRPVNIRGIHADGDEVIVMWDGEGTTTAGTTHRHTSILTTALLTELEVGDI